MNDEQVRTVFYIVLSECGEKNYYLACTIIFCINILTAATMWGKHKECWILSQVHNFINIWYLNITPEKKYQHNALSISIDTTNITRPINYDIFSYISQYL